MQKYVLLFFLFIVGEASGQSLKLEVKLDMAVNEKIYLAHYYLDNIFLDDSVQLNENGIGKFEKDTLLAQGLYKIYKDKDNHFDFLLGADQQFLLSNSSFSGETVECSGADETEEFIKYVAFLKELQGNGADIRKKMEAATTEEKTELQNKMKDLTSELHSYWFETDKKYPGTFLSRFLLANYVEDLDVSALPKEIQESDTLLLLEKFKFQKEHFWEYFDYTDERFLYTPLLKPKLETWFTKVLYQNYDSVRPAVFEFIENVRPYKRIFQFATSWFLNSAINSNILGMDALFVDLAKTYYLSGDAYWASDATIKSIQENVIFFEQNLIGKIAPDLTLETYDGEFINLHKIQSKVTVLLIFEPNCSHCKVFVPKFHDEVYEKYKDKGLSVYAIYSMDKKEEWGEFLEEHQLYDWINVWDEHHASRFKISYDARQTPVVYVLDENKKIISKKLSEEQLDYYIGELLGN